MKLEEMKRIADARTKSEWKPIVADKEIWGPQSRISTWLYPTGIFHLVKGPQLADFSTPEIAKATKDSEFIAMAANNWDKLMAVVEAAKDSVDLDSLKGCYQAMEDLRDALDALEEE